MSVIACMVRVFTLCIFYLCFADFVFAQSKKHYSVDSDEDCKMINFTLKSPSGCCHVRSSKSKSPIHIFGKQNEKAYKSQLHSQTQGNTKFVELNLQNNEKTSLSSTMAVFSSSEQENDWSVLLSENNIFSLNLNYWVGKADVDLSNIAINHFRINSGSADVKVGYKEKAENKVYMDTLFAKVDMGSVHITDLNLSKAKNIIADVGFGSLLLDFGDHQSTGSKINASVGAGTLEIKLPQKNTPVIVYLNGSPLCHIKLDDSFKMIDKNIYVNNHYSPNAKDLMTFNLDVSLGNIIFTEQ